MTAAAISYFAMNFFGLFLHGRRCSCLFISPQHRLSFNANSTGAQAKLKSDDHTHFLADLNRTRSRAAHDESQLLTAAVLLKGNQEENKKNDFLPADLQYSYQCSVETEALDKA